MSGACLERGTAPDGPVAEVGHFRVTFFVLRNTLEGGGKSDKSYISRAAKTSHEDNNKRPESLTVTLTWHVRVNTRYINSVRGASSRQNKQKHATQFVNPIGYAKA